MKRYITCPQSAHLEEIEFSESPEDGRILGVIRCTAFDPSSHVVCDVDCIHRLNKRAVGMAARAVSSASLDKDGS